MIKGRINEIFESLQGEGIYLGEKQIFVRFFGCNLGCKFCDTRLSSFKEMTPKELIFEIKKYSGPHHSISFTGGEPLLQKDFLKEVLPLTYKEGYKNYLETNGTLPDELAEVIDYIDIVAMDLKLPSSTGLYGFWKQHRKFLEIASRKEVFLKAVICHDTCSIDLVEGLKLIKEVNEYALLVLQPDSEEDEALKQKLEYCKEICDKHGITACIIPQIHRKVGIK
ncbi:MAG: 7-carboxy-7-deazaguanine synthase QueE [Candidatus Omnitrophota bacterium]